MIRRIGQFCSSVFHFYWRLIYRTLQLYWFASYSVVISALLYLTLYHYYLPASHHVKALNFHFLSHCERGFGDPLCSFPEASTLLHDSFERASDGSRVLTRGQKYNMFLELTLPLTRNNKHLGMFMSRIDVISKDNSTIASASRAAMLSTQDSFVATFSTIMKLLPLLLGLTEEKEVLLIPLLENYVDDSYTPAVRVNITILSKYVHFYSANLRIAAVFSGMRYYMHNWPLLFSVLGYPIVMLLVSMFALLRLRNRTRCIDRRSSEPSSESSLVEEVNSNLPSQNENLESCAGITEERAHEDEESRDNHSDKSWEKWEFTRE